MDEVVIFKGVSKSYPYYSHVTAGLKKFLLTLPSSLRELRGRSFEALRDVSFEVYRGETFGIVGKNGAGKSTILGLIAGVLKPTKGEVMVKGKVYPLLELGAGFHKDLSGRENILLNGVLMGMTRREVMKKMDSIIEFSELWEFIDQPLRTYSSGMVARLAFSVVAHLDPDILLVDEVLAVGDVNFQKKCLRKMEEFKDKGVTIIFVSHSPEDIRSICDRVMWIDNHTVRYIGKAEEVLEEYLKYCKILMT
ncbi:MAG: ABC transporter ATP-binding protein [Hydrogenobacter thermophilus]|uniref:ABC transporter ATP-binding protein n=1 Tax=Hydrogenobacter thermophilus TaxID=940 RepID=UPI001C7901D0|nr:MAG: ABC transporter ATP-binding protein [Hydrogenobacter thermophilus]